MTTIQTFSYDCTAHFVHLYKFTGKERDVESGLDNFGARYQASSLGRFMSSDPGPFVKQDPQTWNRYAYTRNDPANLSDPTGKSWLGDLAVAILFGLAEVFSGGTATPALAAFESSAGPSDSLLLSLFGSTAEGVRQFGNQSLESSYAKKQVKAKPTRITCPPNIVVTFTGVGPGQATDNAALTYPRRPARNGEVAVNPEDFGYPDYYKDASQYSNGQTLTKAQAAENKITDDAVNSLRKAQIRITPLWKQATNPSTGKIMQPPASLPTRGELKVTDTCDKNNVTEMTMDLYRYKKNPVTVRVPVKITMIPGIGNVECPPAVK